MNNELTAKEAAEWLGLSPARVCELARTRRLPAHKAGREWRLPRKDVARAVIAGVPKPPPQQYDRIRRLLFSHPEMVEDLLRGFVDAPWVDELDFSTLERVGEGFVSDRLDARWADLVWKVKWRGRDLYICLMIEFQHQPEPYMAVRWLLYLGHFWLDQVRRLEGRRIPEGTVMTPPAPADEGWPKLTPVMPFVVYSGKPAWWPPVELRDVIAEAPPGVELPNLRYHVLDESRIPPQRLKELGGNLTAALIRLEHSATPRELGREVGSLEQWLAPQSALRKAFGAALRRELRRRGLTGIEIPDEIVDFEEVGTMIAENIQGWIRESRRDGLKKGRQQGRKEGRQQGEAAILLRLAERKFGPVDAAARRRIEDADAKALLRWADRILGAEHLAEIFD